MNPKQQAIAVPAATSEQSVSSWRTHASDWRIYAAAAASALAVSTNAQADTIVSGTFNNIMEPRQSTGAVGTDFQIAGEPFRLSATGSGVFSINAHVHSRILRTRAYSAGQTIKGTQFDGAHARFFTKSGFAGFKLRLAPHAGDLGWIHFNVSNDVATLDSWAYDTTPGNPIVAGDVGASPSATPEPNTAALMLLASGAAGILAWRKRRAAQITK